MNQEREYFWRGVQCGEKFRSKNWRVETEYGQIRVALTTQKTETGALLGLSTLGQPRQHCEIPMWKGKVDYLEIIISFLMEKKLTY